MTQDDSVPGAQAEWIVAVVRVPAAPSKHRVAVWRELRRIGAAPVGQGVWTVPDVPACVDGLERVAELAAQGDGDVLRLSSVGSSAQDREKLAQQFSAAREEDWDEFVADCAKFEAEIDKEITQDKLTLAELEEEEQSLERLRRWHRTLKARDVFGVAAGEVALARLRACNDRLEGYADLVYARLQHG